MWDVALRPVCRGSGSGFTLLELLVVMAIASLMLALTPTSFSTGLGRLQGRVAVQDIAMTLERARSRAVGKQQTVSVSIAAHAYAIAGDPRPRQIAEPWTLIARPVSSLPTDRLIVDSEALEVEFYPNGGSNGGDILLTDGARRFRITVDWLTGQVGIHAGEAADAH